MCNFCTQSQTTLNCESYGERDEYLVFFDTEIIVLLAVRLTVHVLRVVHEPRPRLWLVHTVSIHLFIRLRNVKQFALNFVSRMRYYAEEVLHQLLERVGAFDGFVRRWDACRALKLAMQVLLLLSSLVPTRECVHLLMHKETRFDPFGVREIEL